jgi:hypothetical protein
VVPGASALQPLARSQVTTSPALRRTLDLLEVSRVGRTGIVLKVPASTNRRNADRLVNPLRSDQTVYAGMQLRAGRGSAEKQRRDAVPESVMFGAKASRALKGRIVCGRTRTITLHDRDGAVSRAPSADR